MCMPIEERGWSELRETAAAVGRVATSRAACCDSGNRKGLPAPQRARTVHGAHRVWRDVFPPVKRSLVAACFHPSWTSRIEGLETSSSVPSSRRLIGTELVGSIARWEYFLVLTFRRWAIWTAETSYREQLVAPAARLLNRRGQTSDPRDFRTLIATSSCPLSGTELIAY